MQILTADLGIRRLLATLLLAALPLGAALVVDARQAASPNDDCQVPALTLLAIVHDGAYARALMSDPSDHGYLVQIGERIGSDGPLVVHIDADSVTLATNARCTIRYR